MAPKRRARRPSPRTTAVAAGLGVAAVFVAGVVGTHLVGTPPTASVDAPRATPGPTAAATRSGTVPTTRPAARSGRLVGRVVVLDPGHDGGNAAAPAAIDRTVWNGREMEACDTTGAETEGGYSESRFDFAVATLARDDLEAEGATVILTRTDDTGVGPCVNRRTAIGNQARADAVVSIHADGGPASGRGFAVLLPVADGVNDGVIGSSTSLGIHLRDAFLPATGMPISSYDGIYGLKSREDLAGTNLTTVPKVFIECGNIRNGTDASLLTDPAWQVRAARGIADGITAFLTAPST